MVDSEEPMITKFGFEEEVAEEYLLQNFGAYVKTGFPKPLRRYRLVYESERASMEESYFWVLNACRQDFGFSDVTKTLDTFAASENSSFWGVTESRKGIQQDRASQYLATVNKMIKELFQIVREIRLIKERTILYDGVKVGKQADDVALKTYWTDLAEGGSRNQMNIYQMAQQVGFGSLPDLFFGIFVPPGEDVSSVVDKKASEFNDKVKSVLKQKLAKYEAWRKETENELKTRHRFMIKHLRQYWKSIQMYISWLKPYLRNVQKLQSPDKYDKNPDLISSFEGALMEIEFIARKAGQPGKPSPTVLVTFNYRVKPEMQFRDESYQHKGPVHVGRIEFSIRSYGWSDEDVKAYIQYREQETLDLLGLMDDTLGAAMEELGDELLQYLKESGENVEPIGKKYSPQEEKPEMPKGPSVFEPFTALFGGFKDMVMMPAGPLVDSFRVNRKQEKKEGIRGDSGVAKAAAGISFNVYKNYKKSHGMPAW